MLKFYFSKEKPNFIKKNKRTKEQQSGHDKKSLKQKERTDAGFTFIMQQDDMLHNICWQRKQIYFPLILGSRCYLFTSLNSFLPCILTLFFMHICTCPRLEIILDGLLSF